MLAGAGGLSAEDVEAIDAENDFLAVLAAVLQANRVTAARSADDDAPAAGLVARVGLAIMK